jgi:hypothetical protein
LNKTMLKDIQPNTLGSSRHCQFHNMLSKVYYFHDISITCETNHPAALAVFDALLGIFPRPVKIHAYLTYKVFCYEDAEHFSLRLPQLRTRTSTVRLLTKTKLKYYSAGDTTALYQKYEAQPEVNKEVLSIIWPAQRTAITQLVLPLDEQAIFLRRYVFLLALGQLLQPYGYEPFHAAAVTAPEDATQGALILGASGSGKTTLSIGCACEGFGLLGDDLVMLRRASEASRIDAYAITHEVSMRSGTIDLWPSLAFLEQYPVDQRDKRYCAIEQLAHGAARLHTSIQLLLFPMLTTEQSSRIIPLAKSSVLQALIDECLGKSEVHRQAQERAFSFLCTMSEHVPGYRIAIARGATDGPQLVHALLTGEAR